MIRVLIESLLVCSLAAFCFGLIDGRFVQNCEPDSVLGYIAIPHRIGCELTVRRFKP
jgi:hypothetical protein